jgi:lysophospholipase L1-like esterase
VTSRLRRLAPNLVLAAVSLGVVFGMMELLARWAHARRGGAERNEVARYMEHDPLLGWRKRPGARVTYRRREYTTEVAVNALGHRDPERSPTRPEGTFRVLALGDSFVEGYTVPLEATVTQQLERRLEGPGCRVEVMNAGTAAWSTDQEYLYYRRDGAGLDPHVVVLFLYHNDVHWTLFENYFGAPKPLLQPGPAGALVLKKDPVPRPWTADDDTAAPAPTPPPVRGSAALEWARDRLARGAPRAYNRLARLGLWEPLGGDEPEPQMRVYKKRQQPMVEAAWERTDAILRALEAETRRHGHRLLVAYVPSRMEVSDRDWHLTRLAYSLDERQWDRGLVARRVAEIGASAGFPVLDLTPPLRAATGALGEPYFLYDGHWNALGHRAAAEAVAAELVRLGWAPPCRAR